MPFDDTLQPLDPLASYDLDRSSLETLTQVIDQIKDEHPATAEEILKAVADAREIGKFVHAIFRNAKSGYVQLRCFVDGQDHVSWGRPWQAVAIADKAKLVETATIIASLAAFADDKVNFCPPAATFIGTRKAAKDDVCEGVVLMVECDARPDQTRQDMEAILGAATLIVKSGGIWTDLATGERQDKLHLYWRLREPTRTADGHERLYRARDIACRLVASDPTAKPIVHPLRWAGSWHKKSAPRLACIMGITDNEIDLDEALTALGDAARALNITSGDDQQRSSANSAGASQPEPPRDPDLRRDNDLWQLDRDSGHMVVEYTTLSSGRHSALHSTAIKIAMSALNKGYDISASELAGIAADLQRQNPPGSKYTGRELDNLANDALRIATRNVGDHPAYKKKAAAATYWDSEMERIRRDIEEADRDGEDAGDNEFPTDEPIEPARSTTEGRRCDADTDPSGEPLDIFASLSPRPVLTPDMLPPVIANFAFDEAERMGVEPACVAFPCLIACAAAIDDAIQIQPKVMDTRWKESARLWGMLVGHPGVGKSPALNKAIEPCRWIEEQWRIEDARKFAEYGRQLDDYKCLKAEYDKARRKGEECEEPEEPQEPHHRRLLVNEMSMEGLAERILAHNERGVLVVYQELMGLIGGFDAYKNNGVKKDRTAALELFDGGPRNRDLVRDTVWVPNWSACILGGIQTDKLAKATPTLTDDGLLQRFLMVEVHSTGIGEDRKPDMDAVAEYDWLVHSLTQLRPEYFGDPIVLSPEAQVYRQEVEAIAHALKEETTLPAAFRGHANKLNGIYARLLLTLHLIETSHRRADLLPMVNGETGKRARDLIVKFFVPHALHLYGMFFGEGASDARWVAGHILAHRCQTITARDLKRANKTAFQDNSGRLQGAMNTLVEYQWVKPIRNATGEKPSKWEVNPLVHSRYAERADQEHDARKAAGARAMQRRNVIEAAFA